MQGIVFMESIPFIMFVLKILNLRKLTGYKLVFKVYFLIFVSYFVTYYSNET